MTKQNKTDLPNMDMFKIIEMLKPVNFLRANDNYTLEGLLDKRIMAYFENKDIDKL